jgi:signal peptidase I
MRQVGRIGAWVLVLLGLFMVWPTTLGGKTGFTLVSGSSMEPTFHTGDLVITRQESRYRTGDVIVYRIATGPQEGLRVIHRVSDVQADGTMTTHGDNNQSVDSWIVAPQDVSGRQWIMIPNGQRIIGLFRPLGACVAVLAVLSFFRRKPAKRSAVASS